MRRSIALACALLLTLNACYAYRPIAMDVPPTGMRVRATVTDVAAVELGGALGPGIQQVEGDVMRTDTAAVHMAIRMVRLRGGVEQYWRGEQFALPRQSIAILEERRLDRLRTGLAIGAFGALFIALVAGARGGGGGGGDVIPPPPPL